MSITKTMNKHKKCQQMLLLKLVMKKTKGLAQFVGILLFIVASYDSISVVSIVTSLSFLILFEFFFFFLFMSPAKSFSILFILLKHTHTKQPSSYFTDLFYLQVQILLVCFTSFRSNLCPSFY